MYYRTVLGGVLCAMIVSGCATTSPSSSSVSTLQARVGELEREVQMKDDAIKDLQYQLKDMNYEIDRMKTNYMKPNPAPTVRKDSGADMAPSDSDEVIRLDVNAADVQKALKNAGYYKGKIDGKAGDMTKAAISDFQKDHGLNVDGLLGRKTWSELKPYLKD